MTDDQVSSICFLLFIVAFFALIAFLSWVDLEKAKVEREDEWLRHKHPLPEEEEE